MCSNSREKILFDGTMLSGYIIHGGKKAFVRKFAKRTLGNPFFFRLCVRLTYTYTGGKTGSLLQLYKNYEILWKNGNYYVCCGEFKRNLCISVMFYGFKMYKEKLGMYG